jgi:hypothetical protein
MGDKNSGFKVFTVLGHHYLIPPLNVHSRLSLAQVLKRFLDLL